MLSKAFSIYRKLISIVVSLAYALIHDFSYYLCLYDIRSATHEFQCPFLYPSSGRSLSLNTNECITLIRNDSAIACMKLVRWVHDTHASERDVNTLTYRVSERKWVLAECLSWEGCALSSAVLPISRQSVWLDGVCRLLGAKRVGTPSAYEEP